MTRSYTKWWTVALVALAGACAPEGEPPADAEVVRIREHLGGVVDEMRAQSTEHLSGAQRLARLETIEWLDEYRLAGAFPHNHVLSGRTPVFVDPHGTPCAVGYLLLRTGASELVEEVARTSNFIRVPELRDEPRLVAWLAERGLSLDEAARIQPSYGWTPDPPPDERSTYAGVTVGMSVLTAVTSSFAILTEPDPDRAPWLEALGVATAAGHLAMVIFGNDTDNRDPTWSKNVNAVGAVAGTLVMANRLMRRGGVRSRGDGTAALPYVSRRGDRLDVGVTLRH